MRNKKIIYIVYPDSLKTVSMNNLAMSELLLHALILSKNEKFKFHISNKLRLIECNDDKIKIILDLLLKAGKLAAVKAQLLELIHKSQPNDDTLGKLKFLIENKQTDLIIKEVVHGLDFTWEVTRNTEL